MADVNRTTVDKLVLHHAVTPLWEDMSKAWLAQWFSDNGYARAYGSNDANWSGLINPYTGGRSYSQAHFAGQRVTDATPDATPAERAAGFRLVQLVDDVWGQITWHAGNWPVNCSSIGIENLGDYRNYTLRDGDAKVIADFWRPQDQALGGATAVYGHLEVSQISTACPARIMEMRDTIVNYINNPPVVPPAPTPTPTPTPNVQRYERITPGTYRFIRNANLWNFDFDAQDKFTVVKSFTAGQTIDIVGKAIWKNGTSEYYMTDYSFGTADSIGGPKATTGVNKVDLELVQAPVVTTKEESKTAVIAFSSSKVTDDTLPKGEERITQVGVNGVRTIVYTVTYTDGKETARTVKSDTVTTKPIDEIISVGTYVAPVDPTPVEPYDVNFIVSLFNALVEFIKNFFSKNKK